MLLCIELGDANMGVMSFDTLKHSHTIYSLYAKLGLQYFTITAKCLQCFPLTMTPVCV